MYQHFRTKISPQQVYRNRKRRWKEPKNKQKSPTLDKLQRIFKGGNQNWRLNEKTDHQHRHHILHRQLQQRAIHVTHEPLLHISTLAPRPRIQRQVHTTQATHPATHMLMQPMTPPCRSPATYQLTKNSQDSPLQGQSWLLLSVSEALLGFQMHYLIP